MLSEVRFPFRRRKYQARRTAVTAGTRELRTGVEVVRAVIFFAAEVSPVYTRYAV